MSGCAALLSCQHNAVVLSSLGAKQNKKVVFIFAGEHNIAQHRAVCWFVEIIVIAFERFLRKLPSYRSKLLSFKTLNLGFRYLKEIYIIKKKGVEKKSSTNRKRNSAGR